MNKIKLLGYLSLIPLVGLWSCSPTNQVAGSKVVYDDLYGGGVADTRVASNGANDSNSGLYANQGQYTDYIEEESIDSYYDESYLSSRDVKRAVSDKAGYSAGFEDGYFAGRNQINYGAYWPSASMMNFNMGFRMGMGNSFFMAGPMLGWGMNRYSMWNSPYMFGGSPYMFNSWGYDPFMTGMYGGWGSPYMGYGFGSSYYLSSMMYGMYGGRYGNAYNPWYYNRPVVIGDGTLAGSSRTYGPRTNAARTSRVASSDTYSGSRVNNGATSTARRSNSIGNASSSRRASSAPAGDGYYARPRSSGSSYGTYNSAARSSNSVRSSSANSGNYYYSAPRSSSSSAAGRTSSYSNASPRSSYGSYAPARSQGSYSSPARSNNSYSQPSYSSPRSSGGFSQPSFSSPRSSGGSYSAPARSSVPSGGGGRSSGPR